MADINRTNSQYLGVESALISDETLRANQKAGIGVGAKLKALNVADPDNNIEAYVVDAFDIDWRGYKLADGSELTSTGQLIEAITSSASSLTDPWEVYE